MRRRRVLAAVPTALLLGGCTSLVTEGEARYAARAAVVSDAALDDTGYSQERHQEQEVVRDLPAGRRIVVVNVLSEYKRRVEVGPVATGELARFTVLSTPQVKIAGRRMNPVADMDDRELAEMLQQEYEDVDNVEFVDERSVDLLEADHTMSRFEADAKLANGTWMEVYVHIAQSESQDDLLVALAVHPQEIDEADDVDRLTRGIEHPVDL